MRPANQQPGHRIFPNLLKGVEVNRVDQVWAADITYIPMAKGFLYLVAIMDWHSRHVLAWKLSNTMDTSFCVEGVGGTESTPIASGKGRPESGAFTVQGSQSRKDARGRENQTLVEHEWLSTTPTWLGKGTRRLAHHRPRVPRRGSPLGVR